MAAGMVGSGGVGFSDLGVGCCWGGGGCVEGEEILGGDGYEGA